MFCRIAYKSFAWSHFLSWESLFPHDCSCLTEANQHSRGSNTKASWSCLSLYSQHYPEELRGGKTLAEYSCLLIRAPVLSEWTILGHFNTWGISSIIFVTMCHNTGNEQSINSAHMCSNRWSMIRVNDIATKGLIFEEYWSLVGLQVAHWGMLMLRPVWVDLVLPFFFCSGWSTEWVNISSFPYSSWKMFIFSRSLSARK